MRPINLLCLSSIILLVLSSCGSENSPEFARVQNIPGEDASSAVLLGQGWNSAKEMALGHCVTLGPLETQSGNVGGQIVQFKLLEIDSETSLRENLDVSATASFKGVWGVGKVGGKVGFANSVNKNSQSRYLLVHAKTSNQLQIAREFTFKAEALSLINENKMEDFQKNCGNEFVYGRRTGGEFFAVFEFEMSSEAESKAFSAAITASGSGWKAQSEINKELNKFNRHALTHLRMFKMGGDGALPEVENLKSFAMNFNTLTAINTNAITLELITKSYDGVQPLTAKPNLVSLSNQQRTLNELAKNRDIAIEKVRTLDYIERSPRFYNTESYNFSQNKSILNTYINSINDLAYICYEKAKDCKLPTNIPEIKIPSKKEGDAFWPVLKTTNWSFRYPADQGAYLFSGGIQNAWIVKPGLFGMSKSELVQVSNQYTEAECSWIFNQVKSIEGHSDFYISESIEAISGVSKVIFDGEKHTDIQFAIKDKKSGKCLGVFFYTNEFYTDWITLNDDSEISLSIRKIVSSIVKL